MPKIEGNARNRILDAAFALFSEKGFTATSMRDIADAVGIKAASLYNHFAGKRELFDALVERETDYVLEQVRLVGAMATPDDDSTAYAKLEGNALADLVWDSYKPFFENDREMCIRDSAYICNIESGQANPTLDALSKIAAGLDVEVIELFESPSNIDYAMSKVD